MMDLKELTIEKISSLVKKKEVLIKDIVSEYIKKIEEKDKDLNCFITKTFDLALEKAKEIDSKPKDELEKLKTPGSVFACKDVFCTKDILTTCGSNMLKNFYPKYESTVTQKINDQGSIMIGKINMDEFSMGSAGITSAFGPAVNLLKDKTRPEVKITPGGSSSAAPVCIQADFSTFSLGGDTGGSVKEPASFCGVIGYRPTYGSISRYGQIPYSSSLDQAGFFTRTINDLALICDSTFGFDGKDSSMSKKSFEGIYDKIKDFDAVIKDAKNYTIAIPKNKCFEGISKAVENAWQQTIDILKKENFKIIEVDVPYIEYSIEVYATITTTEASSNLARYDGLKFGHKSLEGKTLEDLYKKTRSEGFGKEVKSRIISGTFASCSENYKDHYLKACKIRRLIKNSFDEVFKKADIILMPPVSSVAFGLSDKLNQKEMWLTDLFTLPPNLAGLGGLTLPVLKDVVTDLPVGMQIISQRFEDVKMFQVGRILEKHLNFKLF